MSFEYTIPPTGLESEEWRETEFVGNLTHVPRHSRFERQCTVRPLSKPLLDHTLSASSLNLDNFTLTSAFGGGFTNVLGHFRQTA